MENQGEAARNETTAGTLTGFRRLLPTLLVGNLLIMLTLVWAGSLQSRSPDFYYQTVQEDEYLEWGSFWAFLGAAVVSIIGAARQRRSTRRVPWFFAGMALFCTFVAMEEISWGQRIVGYRPPSYFLEHNFQQELNVHNLVATGWRKLALKTIILGYGLVLPLLALVPAIGVLMRRAGIIAPPLALAPAFLATFLTYHSYPWKQSGEWVEFMLGTGFLFAALVRAREYGSPASDSGLHHGRAFVMSWITVLALGVLSASSSRAARQGHPENVLAAESELEALKRDFVTEKIRTKCGLHKRLYSFAEQYRERSLSKGEFAGLISQGLPEERAEFFLDPWNSPYWIRRSCGGDRRLSWVYSFGPNRRRDSTRWVAGGDDVAVVISETTSTRGGRVQ